MRAQTALRRARSAAIVVFGLLPVILASAVTPSAAEQPDSSATGTATTSSVADSMHPAAARSSVHSVEGGERYRPLIPYRILDTRKGLGAAASSVGPGETLELKVAGTGGAAGVPAEARTVALNLTATQPTAASYVSVWPRGGARPTVSSVNFAAKKTVPNLVQVALSQDGYLSLFNANGSVHLVADVVGYYVQDTNTPVGSYLSHAPRRIFDSRTLEEPVGPAESISVPVVGAEVPSSASAVMLNVTATQPTAPSHVTVWPTGSTRPVASSLNFVQGQTVPNRVIARVGENGSVDFYNAVGSVHLVVDVAGYFVGDANSPTDGSDLHAVLPARIADTRQGTGVRQGTVPPKGTLRVPVAGIGNVPAADSSAPPAAVVANITVTQPTNDSYLTAYPSGAERPLASDLNFAARQTVANHAVVALGEDGSFDLYNAAGDAHVVVDILGYFVGQVRLADEVVVLTAEEREAIAAVTPEAVEFSSTPGELSELTAGHVLVSDVADAAPSGFLRRVVSVSDTGVGVVVQTEPAALADVLAQGAAEVAIPLKEAAAPEPGVSGAQRQGAIRIDESKKWSTSVPLNVSLKVDGGSTAGAAKLEGAVNITTGASIKIDAGLFKGLDAEFEASLETAFEAELSATAQLQITKQNEELYEKDFKHFTFFIGPVPVVVQPEFELGYSAAMAVGGTFKVRTTKRQSSTGGFRVHNTDYQPYNFENGDPLNFDLVAPEAYTEGSVEIIPTLQVELYESGEFGVGLAAGPKITVSTDCEMRIELALELVLSFELEILNREFGDGVEGRIALPSGFLREIPLGTCDKGAWTFESSGDASAAARALLGSGVTLQHAQYTGAAESLSVFGSPFGALPVTRGVILSSGAVAGVQGPNDEESTTTSMGTAGDDQLSQVAGAPTADAASLSLTVVPNTSRLQVGFGFASEEYSEYVGSEFNDAFAIFVDGRNCAVIEKSFSSLAPITVNAVNHQSNELQYIDNPIGSGNRDSEADGMTTLLRCTADVTAGQPVNIRFVTADTSDDILDSWAFLQKGSLSAV